MKNINGLSEINPLIEELVGNDGFNEELTEDAQFQDEWESGIEEESAFTFNPNKE